MLLKRLKRKVIAILTSMMIVLSCTTFAKAQGLNTYNDEDITIALDYGHNLNETYKSDPNGRLEVDYAYQIGIKVKENLLSARPDIKIYETNPNKTNEKRSGRADECRENNVDFLFSLHMDSMGRQFNDKYRGTHIIVDKDSRENTTQYIAKQFIKDYSLRTGIPKRLSSGFDNTRNNIGILDRAEELGIPSALLEMGMYSNRIEHARFNDDEEVDAIAKAISDGILENVITYLDEVHSSEITEQNQYIKLKIGK